MKGSDSTHLLVQADWEKFKMEDAVEVEDSQRRRCGPVSYDNVRRLNLGELISKATNNECAQMEAMQRLVTSCQVFRQATLCCRAS